MEHYDIFGMYQPDSVKYVIINGNGYVITADRGGVKNMNDDEHGFTFTESLRAEVALIGRSIHHEM
jgi:hypothetical protein